MSKPLRFGLIGRNVSYSKSSDIFDAIFQLSGREGIFEIFSIEEAELESRLRELCSDGFDAFSITIPHKQAVMAYLDEIEQTARQLEAVNSIHVHEGMLKGYNTDSYGFVLPLRPYNSDLRSAKAVILGTGGAARAAAHSLITNFEIKECVVVGRSDEKLQQFTQNLNTFKNGVKIRTVNWRDFDDQTLIGMTILVNCTPLGGPNGSSNSPFENLSRFPNCAIYYDLNYNQDNSLIKQASEQGREAIDGTAMLVGQAVRSYYLWTGLKVDTELIYEQVFGKQLS